MKNIIRQYRTVNKALATTPISQELHEILLGCLLGNMHIERPSSNHNSRLTIKQSINNLPYVQYLYEHLAPFCGSKAKDHFGEDGRTNRSPVGSVKFNTFSLPQFNVYRERFYNSEGLKIVPADIETDFSTCSLAHWYMDSGYKAHGGYYLSLNKYSEEGILKLLSVIQTRLQIECVVRQTSKGKFIFVHTAPHDWFLDAVKPYMIEHFHNKLFI